MSKVQLATLTPQAIRDGKFRDVLPELYRLQHIIEVQSWHDSESIFDHVVASLDALGTITAFGYLEQEAKVKLQAYLSQTVETHTRLELLKVGTLFHDIGKLIAYRRDAGGNTFCPSHGPGPA